MRASGRRTDEAGRAVAAWRIRQPETTRRAISGMVVLRNTASVLLLIFGFLGPASFAGTSVPDGYIRKVWQAKDGLPEQTVQAFAQTPDHYLWIGTTGGLLRSDGSHLTLFDDENTPAIRENSIFSLLVTRDGSLWIGTEGGGLLRYREGQFRSFGSADGLSDNFIRALFEDRDGTLWVGTDNGLLRKVGDRFVREDGMHGIPVMAVHAITQDRQGALWVGGSDLIAIKHGMIHRYALQGGISQNRVKSILAGVDGTIWVGTVLGLHRLAPGATTFQRVAGIHATVRVLHQSSDGALWIGMIGDGLQLIRNHQTTSMTASDTLPSNTVLNLFEDDERNIWIGTQAGMVRLTQTPVRIVPLPQTVDSDFGTISPDTDGSLWIVSTNVFRMRGGVIRPVNFPGLGQLQVRNILRSRSGVLWIGTDGDGIVSLDHGKTLWYTTRDGMVNNFIRGMLEARDGSLWIATDEGVSHLTPQGFVNYRVRNGLSYFSTRALLQDRNGDIWIGTDRGLNRLHDGSFIHDKATEGLSQKKVWAIHEDSDGGLWFGTRNDGLFRWKQGVLTHYTTDQGLASNSIYQVLEDAHGGFWISGPNGISLLSRSELDQAAVHPTRHLSLSFYGISNDVDAAQIYGGRQPSACLDAHGEAWFLTDRGPLHILPGLIAPTAPVPIVMDDVQVNGRSVPINKEITLQPGSSRMEISWSPLLLRSQDGLRFRYQLQGFDAHWVDAGNRRTAIHTSLPPGSYRFRVETFEVNHPRVVSVATLAIVQRPTFYRRPWFLVTVVLLLVLVAVGMYSFRIWRIRMRFEAVLDERSRLAREMHDTVIQGCTSISALIEGISSLSEQAETPERTLIEHARAQIRTTINEARDAVWNLRRNRPAENSLDQTLRQMVTHSSEEFDLPIHYEVCGRPFVLNQFATHELLMLTREAVHNAMLHGHPSSIDIRLSFARNHLILEINDNGVGFDPNQVTREPGRHYGLVGMRERIQSVGGRFSLTSSPGGGTKVWIEMPRRVTVPRNAMASI